MARRKNIQTIQDIVKHCATECMKQKSGELSVSHMFDAWIFAVDEEFLWRPLDNKPFIPTISFICKLAEMIEPAKNWRKPNFRKLSVIVNETVIPVTDFQKNLTTLIKNGWFKENAEEFYFAFEKLHPFIDGNGRVGNILYNLLNGSLQDPVMQPAWRR